MAANDSRSLPQRSTSEKKKNKKHGAKCYNQLKDLFGSTFDYEILMSVAKSCQYDLDASVSALLKMTETGLEQPQPDYDPWRDETLPWEQKEETNLDHDTHINHDPSLYFLSSDDKDELHRQRDKFAKFEQDRIATENVDVSEGTKKIGTTSLCGLKVQYRPKGVVHQYDDDDADVVVEGDCESSDESEANTPEQSKYFGLVNSPTPSAQSPPKSTLTRMMDNAGISSPPSFPPRQSDNSWALKRIREEIDKGYKVLILLRGVPGSGKSYLARSIIDQTPDTTYNSHVFSADDYFLRSGVYKYDPKQLREAHQYCQRNACQAMREGRSPVLIDNTNTEVWEMEPYAAAGVEYGYIVEILEPQTPWARKVHELEKKNTHNVPRSKIQVMLNRYEWNISGDRLLRISNLEYKPRNKPPQLRHWPRLPDTQAQSCVTTPTIQQRSQASNYISAQPKTTVDDEPKATAGAIKARLAENPYVGDALETIAREYSEMQIKSGGSSSFTAGCSFRENNSTNAEKLGPIGCERIHPLALPVADENKEPSYLITDSNNKTNVLADDQTEIEEATVGKNAEGLRDNDQYDDANTVAILSKCKEFTVLIDGVKLSSCWTMKDSAEQVTNTGPTGFVNDGMSGYSERSTTKDKPETTSETVEATKGATCTNEPEVSPTQSDNGSSNNSKGSSFERISDVDVVSLDSSDTELSPDPEFKKNAETVDIESVENLLVIKNDLSDLESSSYETADSIIVIDQQPDKSIQQSTDEDNAKAFDQSTSASKSEDVPQKESFESNVIGSEASSLTIEAQLRDVSSNFLLIEQLDSVEERRTLVLEEDIEKQDSDANGPEKSKSEQTKNLQSWDVFEKNVSKEPIDKVLGGKVSSHDASQNTLLQEENAFPINWTESSFPVDSANPNYFSLKNTTEAIPEMSDCSTNTDPYDFNVAYLGGIDGYKVINGVSRSINDSSVQPINNQAQHLPLKLMLDKGSMTNSTSVIGTDITLYLENETEPEDRSEEFLERFHHLPQDLLLEVYHKLCARDFNWAVDYISHLCSGDITSYKHVEPVLDSRFDDSPVSTRARQRSSSSESSSYDNTGSPKHTRSKKKKKNKKSKCLLSDDKLMLKQELEMKIQMNEESYPEHVLKIKRWKNREFDEPVPDFMTFDEEVATGTDVVTMIAGKEIKFTDTQAEVEPEKQVEKKTNINEEDAFIDDDEEMVELNIGSDCIRQLEKMFGGGDFDNDGIFPVIQIPKSMAQQLHGFWIETMNQQFWRMQEQLDLMIAKDAEYARSLLNEPDDVAGRPEVPNLKEIMDMEMALATYKNDNRKHKKQLPAEIKQKVTQDTLYEMYPDFDRKIVLDIYEAHERDFEETFNVLKENSPQQKSCITMADVLKKRKNLIDELHKESSTPIQNLLSQAGASAEDDRNYGYDNDDDDDEEMSYGRAMQIARLARAEARRQLDRRNENYHKAQEAYRKKNPDVAAYYSDVAKLYMKNAERENERAASAYLVAQLYLNDPDDKLDLHYLRVSEAIEALHIHLDTQLEKMASGARKRILIITGRGARSTSGKSKIKPAVAKELDKRNIYFSEVNPGLLRAVLKKQ
ncbi:uncharacterized protein LOC106636130 [Copidosoma floridanum]|uniref:uncharacterized protein LOC106636130 n=1 Tax=Copidosoma floridanum TaxID=29053 RepID=UPI0006C9BE40|nr:uncharacterized protein LOC106636130 [Copidosoma floridanum]XP_014203911.1 uncharacterized protein LOC106636130 [Copidosoma floridanum]